MKKNAIITVLAVALVCSAYSVFVWGNVTGEDTYPAAFAVEKKTEQTAGTWNENILTVGKTASKAKAGAGTDAKAGDDTAADAKDPDAKTKSGAAGSGVPGSGAVKVEPETCIKVLGVIGSRATVRLYSTTKLDEPSYYDLYTIEKKDGRWAKKAYIRSIEVPSAKETRTGKYRYYSDVVLLEWLSKGHVYQVIPHEEGNNHSSVPFWVKERK